ncbi:FHA domain containing protein [Candidatus Omnitrophus magneticus]|uniref:FHA domain containing protein n=1 Tax=Candidatus Omnitrophus magneticus TaxID=1609969 RepID=A0A0F0CT98_9BACT|nr:FHA domain containing protein [Candidatus Omnitrophus magneticus]
MEYGDPRPRNLRSDEDTIVKAPFLELLPSVVAYPFLGNGKVLLLAGTIFYVIVSNIPFIGGTLSLAAGGYICAFMMKIIVSTSQGDRELPDWPDFTDFLDDIIRPFAMIALTFAVSQMPAIIYCISDPHVLLTLDPILIILVLAGNFYLPMALIAVSMSNSIRGVNPVFIIPAIVKGPAAYFIACAILVLITTISRAVIDFVSHIPIYPLKVTVLAFLFLYFITVEMRIIGLLYYSNKERFDWL